MFIQNMEVHIKYKNYLRNINNIRRFCFCPSQPKPIVNTIFTLSPLHLRGDSDFLSNFSVNLILFHLFRGPCSLIIPFLHHIYTLFLSLSCSLEQNHPRFASILKFHLARSVFLTTYLYTALHPLPHFPLLQH